MRNLFKYVSLFIGTLVISGGTASAECTSGNCVYGQGTYTWPDGEKYVGDFIDGNFSGQGTYTYANGDIYVGDFIDDKRTGQGTYTYANGDIYVGDFIDGEQTGQGTFTTKSERDEKERKEREVKEIYDRIYNACLLDRGADVDMQIEGLRNAVYKTCRSIADDPSWLENLKYN
jgi:hypothetical protein